MRQVPYCVDEAHCKDGDTGASRLDDSRNWLQCLNSNSIRVWRSRISGLTGGQTVQVQILYRIDEKRSLRRARRWAFLLWGKSYVNE